MTDYSTEVSGVLSGGDATLNSTVLLPTTSVILPKQTIPANILIPVGMLVFSIGIAANAVVLAVLVRARREFGSSVHTLISNQSAMDLFTCIFCVIFYITMLTHGFRYKGNRILDGAVCVILEGGVFTAVGLTAEKLGLVVITLERYFKIVHAIAHRKYYRNWMTSVGVALPWIGATCLILFPAMGTTRIVNGRCLRMGVWPNEAMAKAFAVVRFIFHYALPVGVFAFGYGRIFHTIRRQSKVVASHMGQDAAMATMSRDQSPGQVQQQAIGTKLSRTEMSVLKTMVTVIVCFLLFWGVPSMANLLPIFGIPTLDRNGFVMFGTLALLSFCVNPFIYAARYEVFRRYLKKMLGKDGSNLASTGGQAPGTQSNRRSHV